MDSALPLSVFFPGIRIFENWWKDIELGDESGMWETVKTRKLIVRSNLTTMGLADGHGFWVCASPCEVQVGVGRDIQGV